MPTTALVLFMLIAGYLIFAIFCESLNPFNRSNKGKLTRRQDIACLLGLVVVLAPLVLFIRPKELLSERFMTSVVTAAVGVGIVLTVVVITNLIRNVFSKNSAVDDVVENTQSKPTNTEKISTANNSDPETVSAYKNLLKETKKDINTIKKTEVTGENMIIENTKKPKDKEANSDIYKALEEATEEMKLADKNSQPVNRDLKEARPVLESTMHEDIFETLDINDSDSESLLASPEDDSDHFRSDTLESPVKSVPTVNKTYQDFDDGLETESENTETVSLDARSEMNGILASAISGLKNDVKDTDAVLVQLTEQLDDDKSQRDQLMSIQTDQLENRAVLIEQQQNKIDLELGTRRAAEELIVEQQKEIERARTYATKMEQLLLEKQKGFEHQERELLKSRTTAQQAAELAKKAALAQQQAKSVVEAERKVREKIELRAARAVTIAQNAIAALAEAEKKPNQKS